MPTYEMPVLLRLMSKSEYAVALKKLANVILETGGFIRRLENWGEKDLPFRASAHGKVHRKAGHFLFAFDVPPSTLKDITDEYKRDFDVVKVIIYQQNQAEKKNTDCTLEKELLPPPYRPSVVKLLETAKKQRSSKNKFKYNCGLEHYPFLR